MQIGIYRHAFDLDGRQEKVEKTVIPLVFFLCFFFLCRTEYLNIKLASPTACHQQNLAKEGEPKKKKKEFADDLFRAGCQI